MRKGRKQQAQATGMLTFDHLNRNPFYRRRQIALLSEVRHSRKTNKYKVRAVAAKKHVTIFRSSR